MVFMVGFNQTGRNGKVYVLVPICVTFTKILQAKHFVWPIDVIMVIDT